MESCTGTTVDFIPINTNTIYWVTSQQQAGGTDKVAVYNVDQSTRAVTTPVLTAAGDTELSGTETGTSPVIDVAIGRNGGYGTPTPGYVEDYDQLLYCWIGDCPFPLLP